MTRALAILAALGAAFFCAVSAQADDPAPAAVVEHGGASYYSDKFQGRPTASGEPHDQNALTAASRDLPLGATAIVTNLENGKSVEVEIIDRGPYTRGRVIDLSKRAANTIGIGRAQGIAQVRVEASASAQSTPELNEQVAAVGARKRAARKVQAPQPVRR